ncbi:hypothetical protein ACXIUS_28005 [Bosea thiooxidans]|nr:hypothetical protein [Bosea sp. (in: a-proteobacteria)]
MSKKNLYFGLGRHVGTTPRDRDGRSATGPAANHGGAQIGIDTDDPTAGLALSQNGKRGADRFDRHRVKNRRSAP